MNELKNPNAVALGRLGGKAGRGACKARSSTQARRAANARWEKAKNVCSKRGAKTVSHLRKNDATGCWEWTKGINSYGYGVVIVDREGHKMLAHRASWELFVGRIPDGLHVLHKCDNRPCCNPRHLFLGTQRENLEDMDRKGRRRNWRPYGELAPGSKLTYEQVRIILRCLILGVSKRCIASCFSVTDSCIHRIATRHTWSHLNITLTITKP